MTIAQMGPGYKSGLANFCLNKGISKYISYCCPLRSVSQEATVKPSSQSLQCSFNNNGKFDFMDLIGREFWGEE
jgi:hypothetical protein